MDALFGSTAVHLVGAIIMATALFQVAVLLFTSWRGAIFARSQQELSLQLLKRRVEAETLHGQMERDKGSSTWSGLRKFRINRKVPEGGGISSFYLVPHDGKEIPQFDPGQYLTFSLRLPDREKPLVRCYSLSDGSLQREHYRVSIKRADPPRKAPEAPPGVSSSFFHNALNEGDIVDVKAPSGNFYLDISKHTPVVLIGGGIGLTPMLSMLNTLCESDSQRETWLFYGVRNGEEHIMREHLAQLEAEHENVHLQVCYSNPRDGVDTDGTDYHHAERVSIELFKRVLPSNNYEYYICGPGPMMESMTNGLREWGVPDSDVHFEAFGPASVKKTAPAEKKAVPTGAAAIEVVFSKSGKTLKWDGSAESILELAENNGIDIDSGCRAGSCGTCITALKGGEVDYIEEPGALPEDSSCLACIAVPKNNLTLDA